MKLQREKFSLTQEELQQFREQLLQQLNPQQQEAVQRVDGPVLVLAGAGSGKTRVLTYRVAYLVASGISPAQILALTFTNKAADEMRDRIYSLIPLSFPPHWWWIGTFHSLFARILRKEAHRLGYDANFSIYDEQDSRAVIRQILQDMRISTKQYAPEAIARIISRAKNKLVAWQHLAQTAQNPFEKVAAEVYAEYQKRLQLNNAMDFDDLLLNMIRLLQNFPEVRQRYQDQFRYILVDEYQDTNRAQFEAIRLLAEQHRNLCVVGDDAQSIYGWRGAEISNILDFQNHFPEAQVIRLEQNYRSTAVILQAANAVIQLNRNQVPKKLWTDRHGGEPITLIEAENEQDEAEKIIAQIQKERKQGRRYSDIAVLYRINALSQVLEEAFRRNGIPYQIISGVSFYRRKEVKDTIAYLRLLVNPKDQTSMLRIINEPPRGIGATTLERLRHIADRDNQPLATVMENIENFNEIGTRAIKAVRNFWEMIQFYRSLLERENPAEAVRRYIHATGLLAYYQQRNDEQSFEREQNILRLLDHFAEYIEQHPEATLNDYLQEMSLVEAMDEMESNDDRVKLLTFHAAKGLEFPVVFLIALEKQIFPLPRSYQSQSEFEEERRLFYVGITRAQDKLYFSYAKYRYQYGVRMPTVISPFLKEVPEDLLEYVKEKRTEYSQWDGGKKKRKTVSDTPYRTGMKVQHPVFGIGIILGRKSAGDREILVVNFPHHGMKSLVPEYARLKILE